MVVTRYELYDATLTQPLLFQTKKYKPAPAGDYEFNINPQQSRVVRISENIANIGIRHLIQSAKS
ncbi:MAG: hypothetical protein F6K40_34545 [Okeania sp. SIO3I5]|nr:hypothetical protein [Okeania sp. SIO3I5]